MGLFGKKARPNAEQVAKRARILAYIVKRCGTCPPVELIQEMKSRWSAEEWQGFERLMSDKSGEMVATMMEEKLWDSVTKVERQYFDVLPHNQDHQAALNASWRSEALCALLWCLEKVEHIGVYDEMSDVVGNTKACFVTVSPDSATLRPQDVIEHQRTIAELWHWRSRTRELQEGPEPISLPPGLTMEQVIKISAELMVERGAFPATIDGDFPAMGKPYRELSEDEWSLVRSITMERHVALNWVCGFAPKNDWDRTPTDT